MSCYATGVTSEPRGDQPVHQDPGRPSRAPRRSPRAWREGISINVTLIFSLSRYGAVMDAFLDGMERAQKARHDLSSIASVASFFVSRVDAEVDPRLDKIGTAEAAELRGRAAIANARLAYQHYEQVFSSPRWARLQAAGARPQRPLWASTSTKDPAYPDTRYVVDLVAPSVVNTRVVGARDRLRRRGADP